MFSSDFFIQFAIQSILGLLAVAMSNPQSTTFQKFKKPLRTVRDILNTLNLEDLPKPAPKVAAAKAKQVTGKARKRKQKAVPKVQP